MKKQKLTQLTLAIMLSVFLNPFSSIGQSKKPLKPTANKDICLVCDEKDDHRITKDEFTKLLIAFDTKFINSEFVNNGGVIVLVDNSESSQSFLPYPTFKLHMGAESDEKLNRLLVTYEPKSAKCNGGIYEGPMGIETGDSLLTSYKKNDIVIKKSKKGPLTEEDIKNHFFNNTSMAIFTDSLKKISADAARVLLNSFKKLDTAGVLYKCDDIMFNFDRTLNEIIRVSKRGAFQYYFGFDDTKKYHKIRLIIVGINKLNQLVMYDGTEFLARESSRPRP